MVEDKMRNEGRQEESSRLFLSPETDEKRIFAQLDLNRAVEVRKLLD